MLCCCRCFRRPKIYEGPFPDDGGKGPIIIKQVIDDGPAPEYLGRPITHMKPIPEASPRPSDDIRDMPTMEEDFFVSPVQRSVSLPQDAEPSARAPDRRLTEAVQTPLQ
jgi:hypothetical protein